METPAKKAKKGAPKAKNAPKAKLQTEDFPEVESDEDPEETEGKLKEVRAALEKHLPTKTCYFRAQNMKEYLKFMAMRKMVEENGVEGKGSTAFLFKLVKGRILQKSMIIAARRLTFCP